MYTLVSTIQLHDISKNAKIFVTEGHSAPMPVGQVPEGTIPPTIRRALDKLNHRIANSWVAYQLESSEQIFFASARYMSATLIAAKTALSYTAALELVLNSRFIDSAEASNTYISDFSVLRSYAPQPIVVAGYDYVVSLAPFPYNVGTPEYIKPVLTPQDDSMATNTLIEINLTLPHGQYWNRVDIGDMQSEGEQLLIPYFTHHRQSGRATLHPVYLISLHAYLTKIVPFELGHTAYGQPVLRTSNDVPDSPMPTVGLNFSMADDQMHYGRDVQCDGWNTPEVWMEFIDKNGIDAQSIEHFAEMGAQSRSTY